MEILQNVSLGIDMCLKDRFSPKRMVQINSGFFRIRRWGGDPWSSGWNVRPEIDGSQVRVPVIPDHFISTFTSAAQLVYKRLSDVWIACAEAPKDSLGSFKTSKGISPIPGFTF
jgi:hypothetical protein